MGPTRKGADIISFLPSILLNITPVSKFCSHNTNAFCPLVVPLSQGGHHGAPPAQGWSRLATRNARAACGLRLRHSQLAQRDGGALMTMMTMHLQPDLRHTHTYTQEMCMK
jgi:hypothetical protein